MICEQSHDLRVGILTWCLVLSQLSTEMAVLCGKPLADCSLQVPSEGGAMPLGSKNASHCWKWELAWPVSPCFLTWLEQWQKQAVHNLIL